MKKILIIIICGILLSPAITHAKEIVKTEEIYVRTINMYDRFGNIIDSFEDVLEKEEYEQELSISTTSANNCAGQFYPYCYATEYKTLRLKYYYDDLVENEYSVVALLTWEKEPLVKKYDVFAIRWTNNVSYNSFEGKQNANGKSEVIYTMDDDNCKIFSNAVGITMNMYDNTDGHYMELNIGFEYNPGRIYVTYQHARNSNITFAQSQSYTISPTGLGGVLYFSNSTVRSYYDGMQGITATA